MATDQIEGRRPLNDQELLLINRIKEYESIGHNLLTDVLTFLSLYESQLANEPSIQTFREAEPRKWVAVARTHFQQGAMAAVRAVARPAA